MEEFVIKHNEENNQEITLTGSGFSIIINRFQSSFENARVAIMAAKSIAQVEPITEDQKTIQDVTP